MSRYSIQPINDPTIGDTNQRPHIKNANELFYFAYMSNITSKSSFFLSSFRRDFDQFVNIYRCFIQLKWADNFAYCSIVFWEYFDEKKNLWTNQLKFWLGFMISVWSLFLIKYLCTMWPFTNAIIQTNREVILAAIIDRDNRKRFFAISQSQSDEMLFLFFFSLYFRVIHHTRESLENIQQIH